MAFLDYFIIIIIVVNILYGASKGLINGLFGFASLLASIFITKNYYGFVAEFIITNTNLTDYISSFIIKREVENSIEEGIVWQVLPSSYLGEGIIFYLTSVIISTIALFATFFLVRLCLLLLQLLLKEVFKLPVLNLVNFIGGALFGLVKGLLVLLLIFALIIPISTFFYADHINGYIESSMLARYFYSYNFVLKWILNNALDIILT